MGEYDSAVALALRLITKKGKSVTLRNVAQTSAPDANKPWLPGANTTTDQTVKAVFLNFQLVNSESERYIQGELIRAGDQKVLMPSTAENGVAVVPQVDALVVSGGVTWKVITVQTLAPAGVPVLYTLQVRR